MRALVRGRDALVAQRVALANQLRALLERFWPGAAAIFAAAQILAELGDDRARFPTSSRRTYRRQKYQRPKRMTAPRATGVMATWRLK